ncbi:MAG: hypothetical protein ACRDCI_11815 [Plesiomonas shigelloides]
MSEMLIDFEDAFGDMLIKWTGTRYQPGYTNDEGVWITGSAVPITFKATPHQPASSEDLKLVHMEDGQKIEDIRKTYTPFKLQSRKKGQDPDVVVDPDTGEQYEVTQVSERSRQGGYYKVIFKMLEGDPGEAV